MEIARADDQTVGHPVGSRLRGGTAFNDEIVIRAPQQRVRHSHRLNTRQPSNLVFERLVEGSLLATLRILHFGNGHRKRHHISRVESRAFAEDVQQAFQHQARADQQDDGERHLRDNQSGPQSPALSVPGNALSAFFERLRDVGLRGLQSGNQTEDDAGRDGDEKSEP